MTSGGRQFAALLAIASIWHAPACAAPSSFERQWKSVATNFSVNEKSEGTIGASVAVAHDGRLLKHEYYGFADLKTRRPVNADTIYHWASIGKLFTSIAFMQLVERDKLSLDDRIVDYVPETRQIHNPYGSMSDITLRHLLTHSSGLRGRTFPWRGESDWEPMEPGSWSQIAAMMPYSEIEFPPGSKFGYSNLGTSLLGRVVEEVSGDTIEEYVTKNVLMPLGMNHFYYDKAPYFLRPYRSNNYFLKGEVLKENGFDVETGATSGNGGLNGPVTDMLKLLNFLIGVNDNGNYGSVLRRDTLEGMWRPQLDAFEDAEFKEQIGLGFFVVTVPVEGGEPIKLIGHTGGQLGFQSFVYADPVGKTALVYAMNTRVEGLDRSHSAFGKTRRDLFTKIVPLLNALRKTRPVRNSNSLVPRHD